MKTNTRKTPNASEVFANLIGHDDAPEGIEFLAWHLVLNGFDSGKPDPFVSLSSIREDLNMMLEALDWLEELEPTLATVPDVIALNDNLPAAA